MSVPTHTDGTAATAGPGSSLALGERRGAFFAFLYTGIPAALGLGVALLLHFGVILPTLGTGASDVTRVIAVGRLLDAPLPPGTVVFVGDSVTVEGVDARIATEALGAGLQAKNLAVNGGNPTELTVLVPKVVEARPAAVIFTLRPRSLGEPIELDSDKASAYALGGFPAAWPSGPGPWVAPDSPGMTQEAFERVTADQTSAKLYFRTAVVNTVNNTARATLRRGYVPMTPDDFQAPAEMRESLSGGRLEGHIAKLVEEYDQALRDGMGVGEGVVGRLIERVAAGGSTPVIVLAPLHPDLVRALSRPGVDAGAWSRQLAVFAERMSREHGAIVIDASSLLDASGFADGQHPSASGRETLSRFVGEQLGRALAARGAGSAS